jgi:hypothetical protein
MTLPWGIDWSPPEAYCSGGCLFRGGLRRSFPRGFTNCHWFTPWDSDFVRDAGLN